ncbi:SCO7613 C-terminal domain-containing membrane protein [Marmoricola sp. URHB0036]|uniref:SCO7613 C-terminal domain-containing membrane protein n=1 Tax=Marmoricola sp. URHB0036 TaxID=1298863 RepID=UPI00048041CE|nr:hypothetical protein [Marmoricola sp. URHB0036]
MSKLVDPTLCPDCRALLDPAATCTSCGLEVTGPLAAELWQRMVAADRVVEQLRALSGRVATPALPSAPAATLGNDLPAFPRSDTGPARRRLLPSASVPVVLLSLGALCLLVAATVFVAVAWSVLGLTGRTLVLLGVTGLLAMAAVAVSRRGLRGAAEALWLVVFGMLTVDLLGAQSAGLAGLDALDWRGTGALVGLTLFVTGLAVGLWAERQPVGRVYGAEAVAALGVLVLCATNAWCAEIPAVGCTVAIPLLAVLFVALRRLLPVTAYGVGGIGVLSWVVLLLVGLDRALEQVGLGAWWSDLRGWPLLAATLFAAVVVHARSVPAAARPVAAGLALLPLVLLAEAPATPGTQTRDLAVAGFVVLVLGLVAFAAPRAWALGATVLAGLGVLGLGVVLAIAPWDALDGSGTGIAPWTYAVVGLCVAATLALLLRQVRDQDRNLATRCVTAVAPAVLALGALDVALLSESPLWAGVLAGVLATTVAGGAAWWVREHSVASWVGSATTAYLAIVTVRTASADDLLLALTLSVLVLGLLTAYALRETAGGTVSAAVTGGLAALLGAWALVAWGAQLGSDHDAIAIALALYAALVGVLAAPITRSSTSRITFEVSALVVGGAAATYPADARTSAMALTIVGSAICLVAVARRDRELFSWLGAVVLGLATVMRVALEVQAPELYTLPAAVVLVVAGAWRLRTDEAANSFAALGSGLTLALLPSLLLALDEPVSVRGALVAAAGILVLTAGIQQRLAAPFVLGAVTTGLLALRHLEPYADAVPRWISLGAVGLALLLVGITWEARRRNLETAGRYLADLR